MVTKCIGVCILTKLTGQEYEKPLEIRELPSEKIDKKHGVLLFLLRHLG